MISCGRGKVRTVFTGCLLFLSLVLSSTAFSAGSPFAGVYIGTSSGAGCENGQFAAFVKVDGTFNLLVHVDSGASDFLTNFVKEGVAIAGNGSFFTSATVLDGEDIRNVTIRGTFTPPIVAGTYGDDAGCSGTFTGSRVTDSGPLADAGGYYTGTATGTVTLDGAPHGTISGTVSTIVAADGSGLMVHNIEVAVTGEPLDPLTIGGPITVDPAGGFNNILDEVTVAGSIDTTLFTGSGTTSATFIEPDGTFVESGTFTLARQLEIPASPPIADPPQLVKDINPGSAHAFTQPPGFAGLVESNGALFFNADDGVNGFELWTSDGTTAGTVLVKDVNPAGDLLLSELIDINGTLFFVKIGVAPTQLWASDGTDPGTVLLKQVEPTGFSSIGSLTNLNGTLFFAAGDDLTEGIELWASDGTPAGTVLVKDINPGAGSSLPFLLTVANDTLFFFADDGVNGRALWKSDGTPGGTVMVKVIEPRVGAGSPGDKVMISVNGTIFFAGDDGSGEGFELWKSDGTLAGTTQVKDIRPGANSSSPSFLINSNGVLFFDADDGVNGFELWKSDGTEAGTVQVKDILPGIGSSVPLSLTDFNGTLFFVADDGVNGRELWKSDGTTVGTQLVREINPTGDMSQGTFAEPFLAVGDTLYFPASNGSLGATLWKSDGTPEGTVQVAEVHAGAGFSSKMVEFQGDLYFVGDDGSTGRELFKLNISDADDDVVLNLPSGVTVQFNDNASSTVLHPDTADAIAVADVDNNGEDDVIASFASGSGPGGTGGTFISRNRGALVLLDSKIANQIAVGDLDGNGQDDLLLDFGPDGLWLALDDTPPFLFLNLPVAAMASGDLDNSGQDDLVLSFTGIGTFNLNNFTDFIVLDGSAAEAMEVADVDNNGEDDVIVSFPAGTGPAGTGGTYISKNQGALVLLDSKTAEQIAVGDLDANGQDDLLLDFGADGFWLALDDTPPFLFLNLPVSSIASGDLDNNGQDDMIIALDAIATIVLKNFAIFDVLDPGVAVGLATGNVDGN